MIVRAFAILGCLWLCSAVPRKKAGVAKVGPVPTAAALSAAAPPTALSPLGSP